MFVPCSWLSSVPFPILLGRISISVSLLSGAAVKVMMVLASFGVSLDSLLTIMIALAVNSELFAILTRLLVLRLVVCIWAMDVAGCLLRVWWIVCLIVCLVIMVLGLSIRSMWLKVGRLPMGLLR